MAAMPQIDEPSPTHDRYFGAFQGDTVMMGAAVELDFAGMIDAPHETLAEELGITPLAAQRVLRWHQKQTETTCQRRVAELFGKVLSILTQPQRNIQIVIWGLAFSRGIASAKDGAASMTSQAATMGMHRASLSHWKRYWDRVFTDYGRAYGKSPEACARLRAARIRVVDRKNAATAASSICKSS